jgi:protein involved in polysaccharide export with SLBB domain
MQKYMWRSILLVACFASNLFGQIQIGKPVEVRIQGVPAEEKGRIDGAYLVSGSGTINMPFIGQIHAAGLTPESLQVSLQNRFKSEGIYTNPTIQVVATAEGGVINQQTVTVGGAVRRPGPVPYSSELTLWMAVQAAGGPTEFGAPKRVKLFRGGNQKTYDMTQPQFMRVPLQPNDTVEVPQKNFLGQ